MSEQRKDLYAAELAAQNLLTVALSGPQRLTNAAHLLIGDLVEALRAREGNRSKRSVHVVIQLLNRASNDLRCAAQIAHHGYSAQAATIVSSLYESALTAAYIGADEVLAYEWLGHENTHRSFRPAWDLATVIGGADEAKTKLVYAVYQGLCMPKHINPIVESQMGVEMIDGVPFLRNGPDTSEFARHVAFFSLVMGCRLIAFSIAHLVDALLDPVVGERFRANADWTT